MTDEQFLDGFVIGALSAVRSARAALPLLRAAKWARIVNLAAMSARSQGFGLIEYTAAEAGGARPPRLGIPLKVMYALGLSGDIAAKVFRRDVLLSTLSVRLMHIMSSANSAGIPSRSTTRSGAPRRSTRDASYRLSC